VAKERKFWEILAESQHDKLVLSWLSVVLTVLVIVLSAFLVGMAVRPKPVVVVPGAAVAGVYNAGEMPETVMVQFARNFVVDLANYTPASAEKGYLSAARFMSPELLSRFEPVAREKLKQVVTKESLNFSPLILTKSKARIRSSSGSSAKELRMSEGLRPKENRTSIE